MASNVGWGAGEAGFPPAGSSPTPRGDRLFPDLSTLSTQTRALSWAHKGGVHLISTRLLVAWL